MKLSTLIVLLIPLCGCAQADMSVPEGAVIVIEAEHAHGELAPWTVKILEETSSTTNDAVSPERKHLHRKHPRQ